MEENTELKTKSYVLRAQYNYRNKFDQVNVLLPKGLRDVIKEKTGQSLNAYISGLVIDDLEKNYGVKIEQ